MPARWTGPKTISIYFGAAFWVFVTVLLVVLVMWLAGALPAVRRAAQATLAAEVKRH